ncbi:protein zwilch homolog [Glandiceps talaboti]
MEIFQEAKSFFERLSASECASQSILFNKYCIQVKPAEDLPLKDFIKTSKTSNFVFVQQYQEPEHSQSEDNLNDSYTYVEEEDYQSSIINQLGETIDIDTTLPALKTKLSGIRPLTVQQARWFLSVYAIANNPNCIKQTKSESQSILPIWIPCDGKEPESVCYMGSQPERSTSGQITGLSTFKVSYTGPIVDKALLPNIDSLLREHKYNCNRDSFHVVTHGYAQYDVFGSVSHDTSLLLGQRSSLMIECAWENVNQILQKPPHKAKATVSIRAVPGDTRSVINSVYRELCTLVSFAKGLETGEIQWAKKTSDNDGDSLKQQVISFLKELKKGRQKRKELEDDGSRENSFDSPLHSQMVPKRERLDFTEQLWNVCIGATSYKDVTESFDVVLKALHSGEVQPMVHRSNLTQMAKMVRLSYDRKMTLLQLDDSVPLELLVEMGIDKIRRDYTTYFAAEKLVMMNELDFYTQNDLAIDQQVERVQRLLNVLELTVGTRIYLQLPLQNQRLLIRHALKYYEDNQHSQVHTFELSLEASMVRNLYTNIQPNVWRLEMRSPSDNISICQLSARPVFNHVTFTESQDISRNELEDDLYYFTTNLSKSKVEYDF